MTAFWAQERYGGLTVPNHSAVSKDVAMSIAKGQHQQYVWAKTGSLGYAMWKRAEQLGLRWAAFSIHEQRDEYSQGPLIYFTDLIFGVVVYVPPDWSSQFFIDICSDPKYVGPYACKDVRFREVIMKEAIWGE